MPACLAPGLGGGVEGLVEELALQSVRAVPLEEAEARLRLLARRIQPIMLERTILVRAPFTVHRAPDALRAPGGSVIIIMMMYTESGQTLQGSFSAVSKPNFASK